MTRSQQSVPVSYFIKPKNPAAHLYTVSCRIEKPATSGQVVSLPAWIPGSYMIRDFAKNIVTISARCGNESVHLEKIDKQTWQAQSCGGPLDIEYDVYAWDLSVRSAHLDTTHGYFNGTSVFLCVHGCEQQPSLVEIAPPNGDQYRNWRLASTLERVTTTDKAKAQYGFGQFRATDYEDLVDHPVEMGEFVDGAFVACNVPHEIVLTGRHNADMPRLQRDLQTVCEHHIRFFGEPAPMNRYQFQAIVVGDGYGGLEHRSSTSLLCSREDLPQPGQSAVSDEYRNFLGLCSHEYFHTWMVKRIKPAAFIPYDLTRESHTRQLWAFEGITSYYDELALVRCGLISVESYLEMLGQTITRVLRSKGRLKQSVTDSSFDAWTKFYKQDENAPNAIVSYYVKGAVVALALDLTIRSATNNAKSLDDIMRALWQRFGKTGQGVPEGGFERVAEEVSGLHLRDFFQRALYGTDDLPLGDLLRPFGIEYGLRPASGVSDKGGKPASGKLPGVSLGAKTAKAEGGALISQVFDDGAAQKAGIAAGDVMIAVDGLRVSSDNLEKRISKYASGQTITVVAFRRDELMQFKLVLQAPEIDTCYLQLKDDSETSKYMREVWLDRK